MIFLGRCCLVIALAASGAAHAQDKTRYDRNGNDTLEIIEYARYVLDLYSPPLSQFDKNLDGRIDSEEQAEAGEALLALESQVSPCVDDFSVDYPDGQSMDEFIAQKTTCLIRDEDFFKGDFPERLVVRASTDDLVLFRPTSGDAKRGAMVSLARDLNHSLSIATVKGSLIRPINLVDPEEDDDAVRYLLPSMTVNLMSDDTGKNKNVDTLTFRAAFETGFTTEHVDWLRLGASPIFTTDTGFDLDIRGADLQLEPTILGGGMNTSHRWGPVRMRWRGFFQAEYGKVFDADERQDLVEDAYSTRLGGKLSMRLWPEQLWPAVLGKRLVLDAQYLQLWEATGDLGDRDYLEVSLAYLLGASGNFRLETKYTNGDATQALEDEESFTVGVGVLY